jgi:uncharacterized membrane protein YeaQ/YmgE (transglycosylase-associated protein family)
MNTLWLISVRNPHQLDSLSMQTYIFGAVFGAILLLAAVITAFMIRYEGGAKPRDPGKRRMWFWVLLFAAFGGFFLYNMFVVAPTVSPNLQSRFMTTNVIGAAIALVTYLLLGFALSKAFATGKLGNWFPSKK